MGPYGIQRGRVGLTGQMKACQALLRMVKISRKMEPSPTEKNMIWSANEDHIRDRNNRHANDVFVELMCFSRVSFNQNLVCDPIKSSLYWRHSQVSFCNEKLVLRQ